MQINDAISLLEFYQKHGQVSDCEGTKVMSALIEMAAYPQNFIIPGGNNFVILYNRYGYFTMRDIFSFLGECLIGKTAITQFSMDERFPMEIQQDHKVVALVLELFFKVWSELRTMGMTSFPYVLDKITVQGGYYVRVPPDKLLFAAGL